MAKFRLRMGDKLPHFILNDEARQPIDISSLRGNFLVLYFYPKDNTSGCICEACSFRDWYSKLIELGAVVYGVSSDRPGSHAEFKAKYNLPFSLLSDTAGELRKLLGVPSSLLGIFPGRVTYIFNPEGRLIHVFKSLLSPSQHVKEAFRVIQKELV